MPQRRAAKKALRKSHKNQERNLNLKHEIRDVIKIFKKTVELNDHAASKETLKKVYKTLDKAVSKKVFHPNKVARRKSRLAALINKLKAQPTGQAKAEGPSAA